MVNSEESSRRQPAGEGRKESYWERRFKAVSYFIIQTCYLWSWQSI